MSRFLLFLCVNYQVMVYGRQFQYCSQQRCADCRTLHSNEPSMAQMKNDGKMKTWTFCGLLLRWNKCCPARNLLLGSSTPGTDYCSALEYANPEDLSEECVPGRSENSNFCQEFTSKFDIERTLCKETPISQIDTENSSKLILGIGIVCLISSIFICVILGYCYYKQIYQLKQHKLENQHRQKSPLLQSSPPSTTPSEYKSFQ